MLLYIHIPFCTEKCHYCSFLSYTKEDELKKEYFEALIRQFKSEAKRFHLQPNQISSLFFGGGTPSCVDAYMYEKLFEYIAPFLNKDCEITSEANPNTETLNVLEKMRSRGGNSRVEEHRSELQSRMRM